MRSTKPSSNLLRKGRASVQNHVYLVTIVTNERIHHFMDLYCCRLMIRAMMESEQVKSLAFVVMPDHVHWLVQLLDEASLSKVLHRVKSVSAYRLNKHLNRRGRFWQSGFHDHAIRKEDDIKVAARYIIANPKRAGLATNVGDYSHWDAIWI